MKKETKLYHLALTISLCLSACSNEEKNEKNYTYTGITTEAEITEENVSHIAKATIHAISFLKQPHINTVLHLHPNDPLILGSYNNFKFENPDPNPLRELLIGSSHIPVPYIFLLFTDPFSIDLFNDFLIAQCDASGGKSSEGELNEGVKTHYKDCNNGHFTLSGSITTSKPYFSISYENFEIIENNTGSTTFIDNLTTECSLLEATHSPEKGTCQNYTSLLFIENQTYKLQKGLLFHPNFGSVNFADTDIVLCENKQPLNGEITLNGSNDSSALITFNNCNEYTITLNGVVNIYTSN